VGYSEEETQALRAIERVLNERADVLAAAEGNHVPSEWVLVISWTDMDTGKSHMTRLAAEQMLIHHRTGLLHEALGENWGELPNDRA
jgi:hypothetical protein